MHTGRESICCHENTNSCDKIPPAMSCITDNMNFNAVCTNPAVIETPFNQYLENEGLIDVHENSFANPFLDFPIKRIVLDERLPKMSRATAHYY